MKFDAPRTINSTATNFIADLSISISAETWSTRSSTIKVPFYLITDAGRVIRDCQVTIYPASDTNPTQTMDVALVDCGIAA